MAKLFDDLTPEDVGANAAALLFGAGPAPAAAGNGDVASNGNRVIVVSRPPGVAAFKAAALAALREYFDSQDAGEVAAQ